MDELIALITKQVGVTPDQASQTVQVVVNHLKGKAPALSGQLDGLLSGGGGGAAGLGDMARKLGGLGGLMGGGK